ncbi:HAMP domain-containing sensor histidine kinase [Polaromonas sp.]|uniref:HAMP domain-containing sensor histidine kinase n=1 Tax=Polaromonas sp. TaxID=1869339 RepID=UPI003BABAC69
MPQKPFRFGLFWKLLLVLWLSMVLSVLVAIVYLRLSMGPTAPPPPEVMTLGLIPLVPLVTGSLAMLGVGVAVAWYLAGPIGHMRQGLRQVALGRFDTRVLPLLRGRRDELAELAEDFDRMAAQLEHLTKSRQQLLHDLSHELRSPLARMQAAIGLSRQDPAQAPALLERIERESGRLDELIEQLLTLHRLEAAAESWPVETMDLLDLLHAVAEDADFEARAQLRHVQLNAEGTFVSQVHGELLYRAFENVVRNAVKYTSPGTGVDIVARVDAGGSQLVVTVSDSGPGVAEESHERMFEPFVRLEGSESVRGAGLGLAIALRAVEMVGGSIRASARPGGGLTMTIQISRIPVKN